MVGIVRDYWRPHRDHTAPWAREVVGDLMAHAGGDPVLTTPHIEKFLPTFQWQLGRFRTQVKSFPEIDGEWLGRDHSSLWLFSCGDLAEQERERLHTLLAKSRRAWRCIEDAPSVLAQQGIDQGFLPYRVYHWVCEGPQPSR
jgi:hypothetical protein